MTQGVVYIEGVGLWSPRLPGWSSARAILRGEEAAPAPASRPTPALLAPTERRRAPDTVAVALEVAAAACAHSGRDPRELPSVFASTYGDVVLSHQLSDTLAKTPLLTSPTRFHNSVHNAAAGYWAIATGCFQPYTALAAQECTFAAGLLTAVAHALTEQKPVLYVVYDIEPCGPLATVISTRGVLGAALVLAPQRCERVLGRLEWRVSARERPETRARPDNDALVAGHALARSLSLFEALADGIPRDIVQALAPRLMLELRFEPLALTTRGSDGIDDDAAR